MNCPKCGTENKPKFKFCVKCGSNLQDPSEVNIEQVDMGGYRSEEDYTSEKNSFKIGSGTFTISDRAPAENNGMFTAAELNDTDEEFDFSSFDEPYIPKLDADRIAVPTGQPASQPQGFMNQGGMNMAGGMQQPQGGFPQQGMPQAQGGQPMMNQQMGGMMNPQQPQMGAPMGMYGAPQQPYGMPQQMMAPQIVGYDQNGMPIYSQPQQMMAPQIVGYDQNGMPIYSQPQQMMMAPPQIVGYDQNGMPIYSQPQQMMYGQPAMGENGEHVQQPQMGAPMGMYGAPQQPYGMPGAPMQQGMNQMGAMGGVYGIPPQGGQQTAQPQNPQQQKGAVKVSNEFWNNFFSEGEGEEEGQDDFFGKSKADRSKDMGGVSAEGLDMSRLKKQEKRKTTYMNDTPEVDASALAPNKGDDLNKRYMRGAVASVDASQLEAKKVEKPRTVMKETGDVSGVELETFERKKSEITMTFAEQANADELEAYEHEHVESIMAQADHAVEALPKKKSNIVDEIDAIELPEYMQAKKTIRKETFEIPGLPEVQNN